MYGSTLKNQDVSACSIAACSTPSTSSNHFTIMHDTFTLLLQRMTVMLGVVGSFAHDQENEAWENAVSLKHIL